MIRRLALAAALAAGLIVPAAARAAPGAGAPDAEARAYYAALERNTPWLESTWDEAAGPHTSLSRGGQRVGADGRIVVDLGSPRQVAVARAAWSPGRVRPFDVEVSDDGLTWTSAAGSGGAGRGELAIGRTARYVALQVHGWRPHDARLAELYLGPATGW